MLGSEPIVWYERISASARRDVPDEIPVGAGGSQVEPAAMHVQDRRALVRARRFCPEPGDPTDGIGFEGHVRRSRDSLHEVVERAARRRSCQLALECCDACSESGGPAGILRSERMY